MELLESLLLSTLKGKKRELTRNDVCSYALEDCNKFISTLFHCLHEIVEDYPVTSNLYHIDYAFDYLEDVYESFDTVNKDQLIKKLKKLDNRLEYIKTKKLKNKKKGQNEIENLQEKILEFNKYLTVEEDLEGDFIDYLLDKPRELTYIDMVFDKMPEVMKIKDSRGNTLFYNLVTKYIQELDNENIDKKTYYKNLILMISSKKEFKLSEKERKKILNEIYKELDKLTIDKRRVRENSKKINEIKDLRELVVKSKNKTDNISSIADKYNIKIDFNEDIKSMVDDNIYQLRKNKDREKIDEYIISIDGESSIEIDDALSCRKLENGNYLLGVHIASVLGYFNYNSDIVQNAFNRVHSIYLRNRSLGNKSMIPIFPLEFSADIGSLVEGKERLARSYIFEIDKEGNIVSQKFKKSIIVNNKQTTYEEINNIIQNGTSNQELEKTVQNLLDVTHILHNKYSMNEVYEMVKENSTDTSQLKVKRHGSEDIVYQAMLLTGNKVAEYFAKNNYPCLYRVHNVKEEVSTKIESLINGLVETYGGEQKEKLYQLVNGIYPKSTYDIKGRHDGLQLDHYCHCTSGLRRAADILVEHALEVCYDKVPTKEEVEKLKEEIIEKRDLIKEKESSLDWFVEDVSKSYKNKKR